MTLLDMMLALGVLVEVPAAAPALPRDRVAVGGATLTTVSPPVVALGFTVAPPLLVVGALSLAVGLGAVA